MGSTLSSAEGVVSMPNFCHLVVNLYFIMDMPVGFDNSGFPLAVGISRDIEKEFGGGCYGGPTLLVNYSS